MMTKDMESRAAVHGRHSQLQYHFHLSLISPDFGEAFLFFIHCYEYKMRTRQKTGMCQLAKHIFRGIIIFLRIFDKTTFSSQEDDLKVGMRITMRNQKHLKVDDIGYISSRVDRR